MTTQRYMIEPVEVIQYAEDGGNVRAVCEFVFGEPCVGDCLHWDVVGLPGDIELEPGQYLAKHPDGSLTVHDTDPTVEAELAARRVNAGPAVDALVAAVEAEHGPVGAYDLVENCDCPDAGDYYPNHFDTDGGDYLCRLSPVAGIPDVCATCRYEDGEPFTWPCSTAQAIAAYKEAIEGEA